MNNSNKNLLKTLTFTSLALIAFAANSVLSRLALDEKTIDAASYTIVRLVSGALILLLILRIKNQKNNSHNKGSWLSSSMLFLYAITFSFAYITLGVGIGALILFGSVQITMILLSILSGNRLHISEWIGVLIAFAGFVYLILPRVTTPSIIGFLLMTVSGIAWGIYTLKGRGSKNPLGDTAYNFLRTLPLVVFLGIITYRNAVYSPNGILLAATSGAITSGIGYTIWYSALGGLKVTQAAVVQLSVPVIAALGGVIFVSEVITLRLTVSAILILGGILLVVLGHQYITSSKKVSKI